jgi:uncharacterized protein YbcI
MKTRGELEAEVGQAIIRFEKEHMGRGPLEARTYLIEDLALVRLKNVLTPAERNLAKESSRGRELVKEMRQRLIEQARPLLDAVLRDILGVGIISLHTDISTATGERVLVFTLEGVPVVRAG